MQLTSTVNTNTSIRVPFVDLKAQYESIRPEIDDAVKNVITNSAFIGGPYVKQFERSFSDLYSVGHVVSCANGTDSLYIIMKMLGIGAGDEVITAANSWISSSETITQTGARCVFVDVDEKYHCIDPQLIEKAITQKTKAVIAVHLQGQMCEIDRIEEICKKNDIFLLEDCAQSHFSEYKGKRAGLTGIAGSFSFYPGKNLGAYGDAGCIITNDSDLAVKCRMYANHGSLSKHKHEMEGINSRMDGLQAAILNVKLSHIMEWTNMRIQNASRYSAALKDIHEIILPQTRPGSKHTFHLYVIRAKRRDELADFLREKGIETAIHYPVPLPFLPAYKYLGYDREDFPVSAVLQNEILSLPLYPELNDDMIQYVAQQIKLFYSSH